MKKVFIYIAGIVTGVILTILFSLLLAKSSNNGITMFDKPGDNIEGSRFEVFQVVGPGLALARCEKKYSENVSSFVGPVLLFVNDDGKLYYDDEIIEIPSGKHARQMGIYEYETKQGGYKTVPIVSIME
ncbi:hypothetical protein [Bacteroides reticulotermitis]|uniref:hypothetical protein n=1 Tax=Bacteroides reticulotermitis TaxID=1133319 RepID=UPI003A865115